MLIEVTTAAIYTELCAFLPVPVGLAYFPVSNKWQIILSVSNSWWIWGNLLLQTGPLMGDSLCSRVIWADFWGKGIEFLGYYIPLILCLRLLFPHHRPFALFFLTWVALSFPVVAECHFLKLWIAFLFLTVLFNFFWIVCGISGDVVHWGDLY